MKTLLSLLLSCYLILVTCTSLNAQWVTIPDSNFVNWLQANNPQCMNGNQMDTTCAGVTSRGTVDCSYSGIADLTGIQYFYNLRRFDCRGNHLISLPTLPQSLTYLDCEDNQLTSLPSLPQSLTELYCIRNPLTQLPSLPLGLNILSCGGNGAISSLPALPQSLTYLNCYNNQLTSLPTLPQGLADLDCSNNQLTSLPALPQSLTYLICYHNQLMSLPPLPQSLTYLSCYNNQLTSLPMLPQSLTAVYCHNNQLTSLPTLPPYLFGLYCNDNPNLSCLPELKLITDLNFSNTSIACLPNYGNVTNSTPPLNSLPICNSASGCAVFVWNISGTVATETGTPIPGVTVTLSGDRSQTTTTQSDGSYSFLVDRGDGTYTITPSKNNDVTTNNGITSVDVLNIRRHILGMLPLPSPYKIIAADVDGSSTVTTLDILLTRQMILQMTTTFPNGRLWSFVPSDYMFADMQNPFPFPTTRTYTNLQQSVTGQDFIGIKLGDVNGSWDAGIP